MIHISLSPNTQKDDIWLALRLFFTPWKWKRGKIILNFKTLFGDYFVVSEFKNSDTADKRGRLESRINAENIFLTNSGRSALFLILKSLNLPKGSEALLQAYTCNAAVNPVLWNGFKPVYVDIEENTFNMDPDDLRQKITLKSKVLIIQHTFGKAAKMDELIKIAKENNLVIIEDCAHSLGAKYNNRLLGTFGDFSYFSFGRDKIISSVYGGAAMVNPVRKEFSNGTSNNIYLKNLELEYQKLDYPSLFWTAQQILHPILMNLLIIPFYNFFGLGKILLVIFQKLKILSLAVLPIEKSGLKPDYFPKKMPDALAKMARNQFKKLEKLNEHRRELARFYNQELKGIEHLILPEADFDNDIFLRYTIKSEKAAEILKSAKGKRIILGDWYREVIAPKGTDLEKMHYKIGDCPAAEKAAQSSFNLPTHINIIKEDVERIINIIKKIVV